VRAVPLARRLELIIAASAVTGCLSPTGTSGRQWVEQISGTTQNLRDVWGSSASDVFAVGEGGTILHHDGNKWSIQGSGTADPSHLFLGAVWGSSSTDVFATRIGIPVPFDTRGAILHFDGTRWSAPFVLPLFVPNGVWGSSARDVFVVGSSVSGTGAILHFDGTTWSAETLANTPPLTSVWGSSSTNVIAVGSSAIVVRYDGSRWTHEYEGGPPWYLSGVWGSSANDVFAVGEVMDFNGGSGAGLVLHYDGARWTRMAIPAIANLILTDVWGASSMDVFSVGRVNVDLNTGQVQGTILHYDGARWSREAAEAFGPLAAIWGTGGDVFAVGAGGLIVRGSR
jgi:hypothetical protein